MTKTIQSVFLVSVIALATTFASSGNDSLSPGHRALRHFRKGANFGNYLEAPRGQDWGMRYDSTDLDSEFGAYEKADQPSRARYCADMRCAAEQVGFAWAIWDWKAGFKYWDGNKPGPGVHEALFGEK